MSSFSIASFTVKADAVDTIADNASPSRSFRGLAMAKQLTKQRVKASETSQPGGDRTRRRGQGSFTHHLSLDSKQAFRSHPSHQTSVTVDIISSRFTPGGPKIQSILHLLETPATPISAVALVNIDSMPYGSTPNTTLSAVRGVFSRPSYQADDFSSNRLSKKPAGSLPLQQSIRLRRHKIRTDFQGPTPSHAVYEAGQKQ
ncbi:hypothetical protein Q7P36_011373 [Cladosporium allicinum]